MNKKDKKFLTRIILIGAVLVLVAALVISKSNKQKPEEPVEQNLITNPGFEENELGWEWLSWSKGWAPFKMSSARAHDGSSSVLLSVSSAGESRSTIVWGAVQELVLPSAMPNCLEGYYYVDTWQRGAAKQYIQVAIIDLSKKLKSGNAQMRYIISGVDQPPYRLGNAHYVFVDPVKKTSPPKKRWTRFSIDPAANFKTFWNYDPPAGHRLRLLFEARFDSRKPDNPEAEADVYYDSLYLGPSTSNRCQ